MAWCFVWGMVYLSESLDGVFDAGPTAIADGRVSICPGAQEFESERARVHAIIRSVETRKIFL